jgi:hypothetical protein
MKAIFEELETIVDVSNDSDFRDNMLIIWRLGSIDKR